MHCTISAILGPLRHSVTFRAESHRGRIVSDELLFARAKPVIGRTIAGLYPHFRPLRESRVGSKVDRSRKGALQLNLKGDGTSGRSNHPALKGTETPSPVGASEGIGSCVEPLAPTGDGVSIPRTTNTMPSRLSLAFRCSGSCQEMVGLARAGARQSAYRAPNNIAAPKTEAPGTTPTRWALHHQGPMVTTQVC